MNQQQTRRFQPRLWPTLFTIIGLAILLSLGTWQYGRYHEKLKIEAERDQQIKLVPSKFEDAATLSQDNNFRMMETSGILDHKRTVLFKHRTRKSHPGLWIAAPLITKSGSAIWTHLGWLPRKQAVTFAETLRAKPNSTKPTNYIGIVHMPELNIKDVKTRALLQDKSALRKQVIKLNSYDIEALHGILDEKKAPQPAIFVLHEQHSGDPLPVASTEYITKPYMTSERHMSYFAFWYMTALVLLLLYLGATFGFIGSRAQKRGAPVFQNKS